MAHLDGHTAFQAMHSVHTMCSRTSSAFSLNACCESVFSLNKFSKTKNETKNETKNSLQIYCNCINGRLVWRFDHQSSEVELQNSPNFWLQCIWSENFNLKFSKSGDCSPMNPSCVFLILWYYQKAISSEYTCAFNIRTYYRCASGLFLFSQLSVDKFLLHLPVIWDHNVRLYQWK